MAADKVANASVPPAKSISLSMTLEGRAAEKAVEMQRTLLREMESPNVPKALAIARKLGWQFDIMSTSFFLSRRLLKPADHPGMPRWQDRLFIVLARSANDATDYFQIPTNRVVEVGTQVTIKLLRSINIGLVPLSTRATSMAALAKMAPSPDFDALRPVKFKMLTRAKEISLISGRRASFS